MEASSDAPVWTVLVWGDPLTRTWTEADPSAAVLTAALGTVRTSELTCVMMAADTVIPGRTRSSKTSGFTTTS